MEVDEFRARIFKGATRPAMMLGVPIVPCILVIGSHIVIAMWSLILFGLVVGLSILVVLVFEILVLRFISSQDEHRLNQYLMWARSRFRGNRSFWAARSLSPIEFKKRSRL